jgi:hypothetical protein
MPHLMHSGQQRLYYDHPGFDIRDMTSLPVGCLVTEILLKVALNTIKQQQQQHQKKDIAILTYTRHISLSFIILFKTVSHNVVHLTLIENRAHNISGDKY